MNYFSCFLFNQNDIEKRSGLFLYSLILVLVLLMLTGPYHTLVIDYAGLLHKENITFMGFFDIFLFNKNWYNYLRYLVVILAVLSLIKRFQKWFLVATLLMFHLFQYIHYCLTPYAWSFNTHLSFFLLVIILALFFKGTRYSNIFNSFSLSFPIFYIGCLYFQTSLSKLIYGGIDWITTGRTILEFTYLIGTDFGKELLKFPIAPQILSFIAIGSEFSVIFFIFSPKHYRFIGIFLILFHLGIKVVMNISFWHLIVLYPSLFILGKPGFSVNKK